MKFMKFCQAYWSVWGEKKTNSSWKYSQVITLWVMWPLILTIFQRKLNKLGVVMSTAMHLSQTGSLQVPLTIWRLPSESAYLLLTITIPPRLLSTSQFFAATWPVLWEKFWRRWGVSAFRIREIPCWVTRTIKVS